MAMQYVDGADLATVIESFRADYNLTAAANRSGSRR